MKRFASVIALVGLLIVPASGARADWSEGGVRVIDVYGNQNAAVTTADDDGNTTIAWQSYGGVQYDVYVTRFDAWGNKIWPDVSVSPATGGEYIADMTHDGAGGVIVAWEDIRDGDYDIYVQRIDTDGNKQWSVPGILVCGATGNQYDTVIKPDGAGGAVIAWRDYRSDADGDIYAQRIDASGIAQWTADGVAVCTATLRQDHLVMDATVEGGLVAAWRDRRTGDYNIVASRLDEDGNPMWGSSGTTVCGATGSQDYPDILHDGWNGAFIVWQDYRTGVYDIYAQHMVYQGYDEWTTDGLAVCTATNQQNSPVLCSDGEGGIIVVWDDRRTTVDTNTDIYAQRIGYWGNVMWTADGVAVCTEYGLQDDPLICSDGQGGAIIAWDDMRVGRHDVWSARINGSGALVWPEGDTRVFLAGAITVGPYSIVSNGEGGATFVMSVNTSGAWYTPYLQRIDRFGYWGHPAATITAADDIPGDEGGYVSVAWDASRLDPWPHNAIDHYTVWRSISGPAAMAMVDRGEAVFTAGVEPGDVKTIRMQELAGVTYYWEQVAQVDAAYLDTYACAAPTLFDTTSVVQTPHSWQVVAHHATDGYWMSAPLGGSSGDNLSPAAPPALTAARVVTDVQLEWDPVDAADLGHYAVYRSESSGFTPGPATFLAVTADTLLLDTTADPAKTLYYRVTAIDVHENEGEASNEAMADVVSAVGDRTPSIARLTVLDNIPNPFDVSTELRIGLPADAEVTVELYDVAGRRVHRARASLGSGWQRMTIDGRSLPSGVYFARVRAAGETVTRKMVIQR